MSLNNERKLENSALIDLKDKKSFKLYYQKLLLKWLERVVKSLLSGPFLQMKSIAA